MSGIGQGDLRLSDDRTADLERELAETKAELKRLRRKERLLARVGKGAGGLSALLILGPGLSRSLYSWFREKSLKKPVSPRQTAEVVAAVIRRVTGVGLVALSLGLLPIILLWWQTSIIQSENKLLAEQVSRQARDSEIVQRSHLLATIYEEECSLPEESKGETEACRPKAHFRARQEAVKAFVTFERDRGVQPDLKRGRLEYLEFSDQDFSDSILAGAFLYGARLRRASLRRADLCPSNPESFGPATQGAIAGAAILGVIEIVDLVDTKSSVGNKLDPNMGLALLDLENALRGRVGRGLAEEIVIHLGRGVTESQGASLAFADLSGADLREACLDQVNLFLANLLLADLRGTDLRAAKNLQEVQLQVAIGDEGTLLPEGFEPPKHWSLSLQEQREHLRRLASNGSISQ